MARSGHLSSHCLQQIQSSGRAANTFSSLKKNFYLLNFYVIEYPNYIKLFHFYPNYKFCLFEHNVIIKCSL